MDLRRLVLGGEKSKQLNAMSPQGKTLRLSPLRRQKNPGRLNCEIRASKGRAFYLLNTMTPWRTFTQHQINPSPVLRKQRSWMLRL